MAGTTWYEHAELIEQEAGDREQPEFAPPATETTTEAAPDVWASIVDKVNTLHDDIQAKLGHTRP